MCIRKAEKRSGHLDLRLSDRVFYAPYGYGTVISVTSSVAYPFRVIWDNDGKWSTFTSLGYLYAMNDLHPELLEKRKQFVLEKLKKVT